MDLDLNGKHALVCGASQGIGLATANALAELGADVTLLARRAEVLQEMAARLPRPRASQAHGWIAADSADLERLRAQVEALCAGKPVHILVNNSGGPPPGNVQGAEIAAFEAAYRQHLLANHVLAESVLPGMERDGYGRIVNVISTSVKEPLRGLGVSNTTRWAVASWAKDTPTTARPTIPRRDSRSQVTAVMTANNPQQHALGSTRWRTRPKERTGQRGVDYPPGAKCLPPRGEARRAHFVK